MKVASVQYARDINRALSGSGSMAGQRSPQRPAVASLAQHQYRHRPGASNASCSWRTPPNQAAHEITEKGYVNQRAVQDNRPSDVARLYNPDPSGDVVTVPALRI